MDNYHIHDKAYKYLLSDPLILKELLESFVRMEWVKKVDFKKAESIKTSFISDEFKHRESDVIYKLKLKDKEIYLYLLIEFQSSVDKYIALRMLRYVLELYEYLIKKTRAKQLPIVFPIMLYNGDNKWTAPENVIDMIDKPVELGAIKQYLPSFRYFKIVENEFSSKTLEQIHNIISTIFLIETEDKDKFKKIIDGIDTRLKNENPRALRTFLVWLQKFIRKHGDIEIIDRTTAKIRSIREVKPMLAKTIEKWEAELRKEGIEKGIEKGGTEKEIQLVKKMFTKSLSAEQISIYTDIPLGRVKEIIKNTQH